MKKIVAENLNQFNGFEFLNEHEEVIPGGKGEGLDPNDVDPKEFLVGTAVEMEHTNDKAYAQEIALDHLAENPKYYSEGMKKGMFDEPKAINLYKKYFIDKEDIGVEEVKGAEMPNEPQPQETGAEIGI
jgi:hypothetical protein